MTGPPLLEKQVLTLRNPKTNSKDFRETLEKIGEYLGYEIAKEIEIQEVEILTSLGENAGHRIIRESPTLIAILRAGLHLYQGLQRAFPESESGFIGAMRDEHTLKSTISYLALPKIKDKEVILADTMLATGGSIIDCIELIKRHSPKSIRVATAIASKTGLERVIKYDPNLKIYSAAIDPLLNGRGYIVPGLGDAGDRCFGVKV